MKILSGVLINVLLLFVFSNPLSKPEKAVYPDAIAVAFDTVNHRVGQYIDFKYLF